MNIPVNPAAQTFRLVDEQRDEAIPGALSLLLPGSRGGHLLLSFDAAPSGAGASGSPGKTPPRHRRLAVATSPGATDRWRVLARERAAAAPQTFQLALVTAPDRVIVLYEKNAAAE